MILYVENPKDSTPELLELIQEFSKVAGYKINAQKSVAFLYTNKETEKRETKESIPFAIAPKTIRYLGIKLTKEVKDLYSKNGRTLIGKKLRKTRRNAEMFHAHGLEEHILLKCLCYLEQST